MCFIFWDDYYFCGTFGTDINLTTGAGKAITATAEQQIPLNGSAATVAQEEPNTLVHKIDD